MNDMTVNRFRSARGKVLRGKIEQLAEILGRPIRILDVGGRPDYWQNVGLGQIEHIELMNYDPAELDRPVPDESLFSKSQGDARDLSSFDPSKIDMVHSNSVIEHVGTWNDMASMASELMRVGKAGWVQTPAWEFPIEPHFRTPFMHWFGAPAQRALFSISLESRIRKLSLAERRAALDEVNLLSHKEIKALFPGKDIYIERLFLVKKSYSVNWLPNS
ncbi:MAG: methyltransferase domain-containing protein [Arenibacterium sp.]